MNLIKQLLEAEQAETLTEDIKANGQNLDGETLVEALTTDNSKFSSPVDIDSLLNELNL